MEGSQGAEQIGMILSIYSCVQVFSINYGQFNWFVNSSTKASLLYLSISEGNIFVKYAL